MISMWLLAKKAAPDVCQGRTSDPRYHPDLSASGHLMSSNNGDEPFRSSRTAPKWLLCGVDKGLSPYPLSLLSVSPS